MGEINTQLMKMAGTVRCTLADVDLEWEIENFSETKDCTASRFFLLSDAFLRLWMLRNNENGWLSLGIERKDSIARKYRIRVSIGIKKSDGSVYKCKKFEYELTNNNNVQTIRGCSKFIEYSKLLEMKDSLLQKDTLKIFCVARLLDPNTVGTTSQTVSLEGFETLIENFTDLYRKKNFRDVTIRLHDREFQAHESILSARSPVFAAMFKHDMVEKKSRVVDIIDCDSNSFEDVLLHLYTGKMDKLSPDNVFDIYRTADKYDVKGLREKCTQYLSCDLSVDSFCDVFLKAMMHNESELLESVTEFFCKNIKTILLTTKWLSFLENYPLIANELVMKALCKN